MAKPYVLTRPLRLVNAAGRVALRFGLAPPGAYLLTVRGRHSGRRYTTPVALIEEPGRRYLVAPYGEVGWVRNARAAGEVELRRGRRHERLRIHEVDPPEAGPVLRTYARKNRIVRPYFDARHDGPLEAFVAEASRHPVFRLEPL
jgi:deazaflavin-dependent oxidoreductase (nitroreductase family)